MDTGRQAQPRAAEATRRQRLLLVVRAVARDRTRAAPLGYKALAGIVLALGVTAQALLGWSWWLVVAVLTVVGEAAIVGWGLARTGEREQPADRES
jgi:hypothetical protein